MSPVAAPADRRFRRVHVKPSRRRRRWHAVVKPAVTWLVLVGLLAFGVYRTTSLAAHAGVLRIDRIAVRGNERLSRGEVLAILGGLRGENLLWTNLDRWRQRLLTSPWVQDASLRRSLPSTVDVVISERVPIGIARIGGEMLLIDERGTVIDQYGPQYADFDLPIVDGLSMQSGRGQPPADAARAELAARVIAALASRPAVGRRLSQVDVSDAHNASVVLNGDGAVIHLGEDQFLQRIESYLDLAPALRERVADIDYVDLRFDDRIYVRPAGNGRRHAGTQGAPSAARK